MATSTLLQKLDGGSDFGVTTTNRRETEVFIAKETVAVGDWVAFDYGATEDGDVTLGIYKADTNSTPKRPAIGVVLETLDVDNDGVADYSAGSRIRVVLSGVCDAKTSDNGGAGMAIGDTLHVETTAGEADLYVNTSTQPVCGILAETVAAAAGSGTRRVVVIKQF